MVHGSSGSEASPDPIASCRRPTGLFTSAIPTRPRQAELAVTRSDGLHSSRSQRVPPIASCDAVAAYEGDSAPVRLRRPGPYTFEYGSAVEIPARRRTIASPVHDKEWRSIGWHRPAPRPGYGWRIPRPPSPILRQAQEVAALTLPPKASCLLCHSLPTRAAGIAKCLHGGIGIRTVTGRRGRVLAAGPVQGLWLERAAVMKAHRQALYEAIARTQAKCQRRGISERFDPGNGG
jgi:hypothetical protein